MINNAPLKDEATGLNLFSSGNNSEAKQQEGLKQANAAHCNYYIISEPWEVQQLSKSIMAACKNETPILGVDCEGLAKKRRMQLIQVYWANKSFLIDIQAVNPFLYGFREVMESQQVMKIFHDFCEDTSALVS